MITSCDKGLQFTRMLATGVSLKVPRIREISQCTWMQHGGDARVTVRISAFSSNTLELGVRKTAGRPTCDGKISWWGNAAVGGERTS